MSKRRFSRRKLLFESFLATVVVYALLVFFGLIIRISLKPFDFVSQMFEDVKVSDLYFSNLSNNSAIPEIILINIGDLDREGIAALLERVNEFNPRVIGLDVFFSDRVDETGDPLLISAIESVGDKLVLVSLVDDEKNKIEQGYKHFDGVTYGHANLIINAGRTKTVREFKPYYLSDSDTVWSFSSTVAKKYDPKSFSKLAKRNSEIEEINYTGDANSFVKLSYADLFELPGSQLSGLLNDKIVMLGFMGGTGRDASDFKDIFFTPLNQRFVGRSFPDMYGLVIHANSTAMILQNNYIHHLPTWLVILISITITYMVNVALSYFFIQNQIWYDIFAKFTQFASSIIIIFLIFVIFRYTNLLIPSKYLILGVVFAVDFLYVYESFALLAHKYFKWNSLFLKTGPVKRRK
jgi:CHASE2 domain-containing sensor protein